MYNEDISSGIYNPYSSTPGGGVAIGVTRGAGGLAPYMFLICIPS